MRGKRTIGIVIIATSGALLAFGDACQSMAAPPPTVGSGGSPGSAGGGASPDASSGGASGGVLASGLFSPRAIALDPSNVYWTTSNGVNGALGDASAGVGGVQSVSRTGGDVVDILAGLSGPQQLSIYSTTLFFAQGVAGSAQLDEYTLGGTVVTEVATSDTPSLPMIMDESTLYWASGTGTRFALYSLPATGGAASDLFTGSEPYEPLAIGVYSSSLFILASVDSEAYVLEAATTGGGPTTLWHGAEVQPVSLVVSGATIYWSLASSSEGGEILSTSVSGGQVYTLASNVENVGSLAVLSNTVYFTSNVANGAVLSVSTAGGAVSTLASGLDYPSALAVDDAVYVGTASTITRVPF